MRVSNRAGRRVLKLGRLLVCAPTSLVRPAAADLSTAGAAFAYPVYDNGRNPTGRKPANLPTVIFQFALSPYAYWQSLARGGALLITASILVLNIAACIVASRSSLTR